MSACEKCWGDAYSRMMCQPEKSQTEHYRDLLNERKDNPCTPEEQAGTDRDASRSPTPSGGDTP